MSRHRRRSASQERERYRYRGGGSAHVREVTAAEFVRTDNVNKEIPEATEVGVLDDEVAATGLAVALLHRWNVAATGAHARVVADRASAVRMVSCASFLLPVCFLQVWMRSTVHVDDVLIARADELRRGSLLQLENRHTKALAEPRRPRRLALLRRP